MTNPLVPLSFNRRPYRKKFFIPNPMTGMPERIFMLPARNRLRNNMTNLNYRRMRNLYPPIVLKKNNRRKRNRKNNRKRDKNPISKSLVTKNNQKLAPTIINFNSLLVDTSFSNQSFMLIPLVPAYFTRPFKFATSYSQFRLLTALIKINPKVPTTTNGQVRIGTSYDCSPIPNNQAGDYTNTFDGVGGLQNVVTWQVSEPFVYVVNIPNLDRNEFYSTIPKVPTDVPVMVMLAFNVKNTDIQTMISVSVDMQLQFYGDANITDMLKLYDGTATNLGSYFQVTAQSQNNTTVGGYNQQGADNPYGGNLALIVTESNVNSLDLGEFVTMPAPVTVDGQAITQSPIIHNAQPLDYYSVTTGQFFSGLTLVMH